MILTIASSGLLATVGVLNIQTNNFTNNAINANTVTISADTFNLSVAGDFPQFKLYPKYFQ